MSRWLCQGMAGQAETQLARQGVHDLDAPLAQGCEIAGGPTELDGQEPRLQLVQPCQMARQGGQPARHLEAEARWQRLLKAGPGDRRRRAMCVCQPAQRPDQPDDPPLQDRQHLTQLENQGRVHDVLRGGAPVDERRLRPADGTTQLRDQRRDGHTGSSGPPGEVGKVRLERGEGCLDPVRRRKVDHAQSALDPRQR